MKLDFTYRDTIIEEEGHTTSSLSQAYVPSNISLTYHPKTPHIKNGVSFGYMLTEDAIIDGDLVIGKHTGRVMRIMNVDSVYDAASILNDLAKKAEEDRYVTHYRLLLKACFLLAERENL